MAIPASSVLFLTPKLRITLSTHRHRPYQLHGCSLWHVHGLVSLKVSMRRIVAQDGKPSNNAKMQLGMVREQIWKALPRSVKEFPCKKAGEIFSEKLISYGEKILKWPLTAIFIVSSLSDALFSISKNQELMIPFGLLAGYLMTTFLQEVLQQVFPKSEVNDFHKQVLGVGCFCVILKFISAKFAIQSRVFLLHVANGGLMQVLWLWRSLVENNYTEKEENSVPSQSDSLT